MPCPVRAHPSRSRSASRPETTGPERLLCELVARAGRHPVERQPSRSWLIFRSRRCSKMWPLCPVVQVAVPAHRVALVRGSAQTRKSNARNHDDGCRRSQGRSPRSPDSGVHDSSDAIAQGMQAAGHVAGQEIRVAHRRVAGHAQQDVAVFAFGRDAGEKDHVVAAVFSHAAEAPIDQPDDRMKPPRRAQQHLDPRQPGVAAPKVSQFMDEDGVELARRKSLGRLGKHDRRPEAADREGRGSVRGEKDASRASQRKSAIYSPQRLGDRSGLDAPRTCDDPPHGAKLDRDPGQDADCPQHVNRHQQALPRERARLKVQSRLGGHHRGQGCRRRVLVGRLVLAARGAVVPSTV